MSWAKVGAAVNEARPHGAVASDRYGAGAEARSAYADLADAHARIGAFIEEIDNADRLHSALGCKSPIAFGAELQKKNVAPDRTTANALSPN
jgi:hypothetical protein